MYIYIYARISLNTNGVSRQRGPVCGLLGLCRCHGSVRSIVTFFFWERSERSGGYDKETMENHDIYIYIYLFVFRHKLPCLSRELVGNMGNHWKPYCNWFCSDRLPEVEQPNTHLAHRLPSVVRGDPGILICLRLHLVGPGVDMTCFFSYVIAIDGCEYGSLGADL